MPERDATYISVIDSNVGFWFLAFNKAGYFFRFSCVCPVDNETLEVWCDLFT